ncbi:MAG: CAP domain-containing protein [Myxococcales bacterium]|nr:CAP domain-containing protein [Myxococcales bacterium]
MRTAAMVVAAFGLLAGLWVLRPSGSQAFAPDNQLKSSNACKKGPLRNPRPNCAPPPLPSTGDPYRDCVARINQLRWKCQCLPALARWKGGEKCANKHAKYDGKRGNHAGFNDGICKPKGSAQNECPGWPSTAGVIDGCLQAMWDEGPGKRFSKHGHYINMSNTKYDRVACGFAKTPDGTVWSVQNFR